MINGWELSNRKVAAPKNDPALFRPVRVRVVRPFCVGGQRQEIGSTVTLPKHDADSMVAIKRAEYI